jgi:hypothetical protein
MTVGIDVILGIGGKLIDRLWPDPKEAEAAKLKLFEMQQAGELQIITGQLEVNKAEAASASVFVSGWRPFVGWVCGSGCAWNWIGLPVAKLVCEILGKPIQLQPADLSEMLPLLVGMLGLGGLRTYERVKDVARTK